MVDNFMSWLVVDNFMSWLVVDNFMSWLVVDNFMSWLVVDNFMSWLVVDNFMSWSLVFDDNMVMGSEVLVTEMLTDSGVVWQMVGKKIVGGWSSMLILLQAMSDDFTENMVLGCIVFIAEFG
jgi:hypothetical protein